MARDRIAFVHISPGMSASFVRRDFEILSSEYEVSPVYYTGLEVLPRLISAVSASSAVVCWFAWDHALWAFRAARILGKPSVLITGGFDVVGLPEIQYGALLTRRSASRVQEAVRRATRILAISRSIQSSLGRLSPRSDVEVVPLGYNPNEISFSEDKEDLVISVGAVTDQNLSRKGMGSFVEVARHLPGTRFALIGRVDPNLEMKLRATAPSNLLITGYVSDHELKDWFRRAKVYVQLSAHEGFGSAVAEAMLAGCLPVVTDRGALREVVGEQGIFVPFGDIAAATGGVVAALDSSTEARRRCRERVCTEFSLNRRRMALLATMSSLLRRQRSTSSRYRFG